MVDLKQLLEWKPAELGNAADLLVMEKKRISDLQSDINEGAQPANWIGHAAEAAKASHANLRDKLNDIVNQVASVAVALDPAQDAVRKAHDKATGAISAAEGKGFTVEYAGGGPFTVKLPSEEKRFPNQAAADAYEADIAKLAKDIADELDDALAAANDADNALGDALNDAFSGKDDGGQGSLRDAGLPEHLRKMSPHKRIEELLKHPNKYAGVAPLLTDADQKALGSAISDLADPLTRGAHSSVMGGRMPTPHMTPEDLADLNKVLAAYGDSPTVATRIANDLGTSGLIKVQTAVLGHEGDDRNEYGPGAVRDSQEAWGKVLGAATKGLYRDDGSAPDAHVSAHWVDNLLQHGGKTYDLDSDGDEKISGFQALGPLLRSPEHNGAFLKTVGAGMEQYEQGYRQAHHGHSPWNQLGGGERVDYSQGSHQTDVFGDRHRVAKGNDPFGGLFGGLAHKPHAAHEFLSDDSGVHGNRVAYYENDRHWPQGEDGHGYPTARQSYNDAMEAAQSARHGDHPDSLDRRIDEAHQEVQDRQAERDAEQKARTEENMRRLGLLPPEAPQPAPSSPLQPPVPGAPPQVPLPSQVPPPTSPIPGVGGRPSLPGNNS